MAQSLAAHYGMLLGLDQSWEVADVKLELKAKRVCATTIKVTP